MICTNTCRRGVSIIETLMVISLLSVFTIALGGLFLFAWRADKSSRNYRTATNAVMRLESQLREDVHAARLVELTDASSDMPKLSVVLPSGKKIEYAVERGAIMRTLLEGDQTIRREFYQVPVELEPQWSVEARGGTTHVGFELRQRESGDQEGVPLGEGRISSVQVGAIVGASPEIVEVRKASP